MGFNACSIHALFFILMYIQKSLKKRCSICFNIVSDRIFFIIISCSIQLKLFCLTFHISVPAGWVKGSVCLILSVTF